MNINKLGRVALFSFILFSSLVINADTTSNIRGKVVDVSGELVPNADIVLTYGPTNTTQSVSSNADGTFAMFNLQLGGPYRITADSGNSSGYLDK